MSIKTFLHWWLEFFIAKCCKGMFWALLGIVTGCAAINERILKRWRLANDNQERLWNNGYRRNTRG